MKRLFVAALLLVSTVVTAQETRTYLEDPNRVPREHNVDFQHLTLEARFNPEAGQIFGTVTHTFKPLQQEVTEIWLDAPGIKIDWVKLDGTAVRYQQKEGGITITLGKTLTWDSEYELKVAYEATPRKGLYFIGWNDPSNRSRKQIWTQGQGIDNRHWIPMYDEMNDKVTTEMLITFDGNYKVLSNGVKEKVKVNRDGTATWHYKMSKPHAPYLIMLGIGEYEINTIKAASGTEINLWYYPDQPEKMEPTYRFSKEMFDWFEAEIGVPYPWETYSQIPVQDFMFGAMENTTATLFGDFYYVDERAYLDKNYVRVNAHELAHQWFGDMITARSSQHHWLQESFATHYDMTYQGVAFGTDHFDWVRRTANNSALDATKKDYFPVGHSEGGVTRHYPKGAFVLQMLKYVVGREAFNRSVKHYLEKHAYGNVDSEDLLIAFHETLGLSLDWFWEQWIYHGGEPHYEVEFRETSENGQRIGEFTVEQTHETNDVVGLFKMPIWFEVHFSDGSKAAEQVMIEDQHHRVSIKLPEGKRVAYVLFDPNNEVMKSVSFAKPTEMLWAQATTAEHMLDRYDAIVALESVPVDDKWAEYTKLFEKETWHAPKVEMVRQLANHERGKAVLRAALRDDDPLVVRAVFQHTDLIPKDLLEAAEAHLNAKSYWVVEDALTKLTYNYPQNVKRYLETTADEVGFRGSNIRVKWLEISASGGNEEATQELVSMVSNSWDFQSRVNAAQALKRLNYCDKQLISYLFDAIISPNTRLGNPCKAVLRHFDQQLKYKALIHLQLESGDWKDWQRQKLENALK